MTWPSGPLNAEIRKSTFSRKVIHEQYNSN
jgi:hypothetical protein